ncbi:MAG: tyrosine--tRNA ligase [Planctomycetota bacterium]|nr:MAG: tyrosine--tRNA ligase [Planctomycetota bacterium]
MSKFPPVDEQLARIKRGVVDLVQEPLLRARLEESRQKQQPLRVKFGIDPSSPDIHIGHTVPLRKLRSFQELGHLPVIIWGSATARVGDPTGKSKTRPQLTLDQVRENLATYQAQIGKVLDIDACEQHENGEWFDSMGFADFIRLMGRMTVARAIENDTVGKRLEKQEPVSLHELIYPLMQGQDSVEIRCDVEIGGSDQLYNLLVGRMLQEQAGQAPQVCLTMPIIEGLDGVQKMSKSLGNYIGIHDQPKDMFGKVMSVPDELMQKYFLLLTDTSPEEIETLLAGHPREAKATLAERITADLHGEAAGREARAEFDRVFQQKALPSEIPERDCDPEWMRDGEVLVAVLVHKLGLAQSGSEARRLIQQKGVKVDGEAVQGERPSLKPGSYLLQVGRRKFVQVRIPD